jgi:hypothetical protein
MTSPRVLSLSVLPGRLAVCRLDPGRPIPAWAWCGPLQSVTRTGDEISVICPEEAVPSGTKREQGRRALRVNGPLAFSEVGVLASLTAPLAAAGISILSLSTFDTDYLLVNESDLERAMEALREEGHHVRD